MSSHICDMFARLLSFLPARSWWFLSVNRVGDAVRKSVSKTFPSMVSSREHTGDRLQLSGANDKKKMFTLPLKSGPQTGQTNLSTAGDNSSIVTQSRLEDSQTDTMVSIHSEALQPIADTKEVMDEQTVQSVVVLGTTNEETFTDAPDFTLTASSDESFVTIFNLDTGVVIKPVRASAVPDSSGGLQDRAGSDASASIAAPALGSPEIDNPSTSQVNMYSSFSRVSFL
jgi:hypothetical protein